VASKYQATTRIPDMVVTTVGRVTVMRMIMLMRRMTIMVMMSEFLYLFYSLIHDIFDTLYVYVVICDGHEIL
jgi:hypothetical protein